MNRPDPIEYAERLYGAIRAAKFSTISFLSFGNAIKDGVPLRNMSRIAVEPFMRVVGEMIEFEDEIAAEGDVADAQVILASTGVALPVPPSTIETTSTTPLAESPATAPERPTTPATEPADSTTPSVAAGASARGPGSRRRKRRSDARATPLSGVESAFHETPDCAPSNTRTRFAR